MATAIIATGFNGVQFEEITRNNEPWIRGSQVASALGYAKPERVTELYTRHAEEFTDSMTAVITLPTPGGPQETRIFSLRGCHLLAMFARTTVAKQFRVWVLDVLETLNKVEPLPLLPDTLITPDQQCTLQAIVKAKVEAIPEAERGKGLFPQIWGRFKNHFRVSKYDQLPQSRMSEAVAYLTSMEIAQPKALPAPKVTQKALVVAPNSPQGQVDALMKKVAFYINEVDAAEKLVADILIREFHKAKPDMPIDYSKPEYSFYSNASCSTRFLWSSVNFALRAIEDSLKVRLTLTDQA